MLSCVQQVPIHAHPSVWSGVTTFSKTVVASAVDTHQWVPSAEEAMKLSLSLLSNLQTSGLISLQKFL